MQNAKWEPHLRAATRLNLAQQGGVGWRERLGLLETWRFNDLIFVILSLIFSIHAGIVEGSHGQRLSK